MEMRCLLNIFSFTPNLAEIHLLREGGCIDEESFFVGTVFHKEFFFDGYDLSATTGQNFSGSETGRVIMRDGMELSRERKWTKGKEGEDVKRGILVTEADIRLYYCNRHHLHTIDDDFDVQLKDPPPLRSKSE